MFKRAAGMVLISAALCGAVALLGVPQVPQEENETDTAVTAAAVLEPNTEDIQASAEHSVGVEYSTGVRDSLTASADYGMLFPYAAAIYGWDAEGTPVYRYAMADSSGEIITKAVYSAVERTSCGSGIVWMLTQEIDGVTYTACAAQDGSWMLGPFQGSITVWEQYIFVQRTGNASVTTVYNTDGKIIGAVNGTVVSCADGVIVSTTQEEDQILWRISDAATCKEVTSFNALRVGAFSDNYATVQLSETEWGFVDAKGIVTKLEPIWAEVQDTNGGYVLAQNTEGKYGVLATTGKAVIEAKYSKAVQCGEDIPLYQVWEDADTCEVIYADRGQKLMLPKDLNGQTLIGLPENYFAYVNEDGNTVVFDDLKSTELEGDGWSFSLRGKMIVCYNETGYYLFRVSEGELGKLHTNLCVDLAEENTSKDTSFTVADPDTGLQGIGNTRGRLLLDTKYESVSCIDGSYFAAIKDGWSGVLDANGNWIVCSKLDGTK